MRRFDKVPIQESVAERIAIEKASLRMKLGQQRSTIFTPTMEPIANVSTSPNLGQDFPTSRSQWREGPELRAVHDAMDSDQGRFEGDLSSSLCGGRLGQGSPRPPEAIYQCGTRGWIHGGDIRSGEWRPVDGEAVSSAMAAIVSGNTSPPDPDGWWDGLDAGDCFEGHAGLGIQPIGNLDALEEMDLEGGSCAGGLLDDPVCPTTIAAVARGCVR